MPREKEILLQIAAKAATLFERLGGNVVHSVSSNLKAEAIESRLSRWRQAVTGDDAAAGFESRLKLSGIDLKKSAPYLGEVTWRSGKKLPKWVSVFEEILKIKDLKSVARVFQKKNPIPFEEIVSPFVVYAERQVGPLKKKLAARVDDAVWGAFERTLLCRLSALSAKPLFLKFQEKLNQESSLALFQDLLKQDQKKSRGKYQQFAREFLATGGLSFYQEYAVLARLLVTVTEQWVTQTKKFFERLEKDRPAIRQTFHAGKSLGKLKKVGLGLSDPHHAGATVVSLEFATGLRLIYKPKNLKTETGFLKVLSWLNQNGAPFPFKVLQILNQHQYGWIEFAASRACHNEDQVRRYYTKMGMLLGVVYFLDGTDCHAENILACGEEPVLLDMESLLQHSAQNGKNGEAEKLLDRSVLRTGILPTWIAAKEGKCYDVSPLAPSASQLTGFRYSVWKNINTDQMHSEKEETILNLAQNSPTLKNKKISVERYQSQVMAGFESIYRLMVAKRREFMAANGPLRGLKGCQTRFIYRPTNVYAQLALRLLDEPYLKEGVDLSIEIEVLTRNLISLRDRKSQEPLWAAYEAERKALERCDIPCFYGQTNEIGLYCDEKKIVSHFFQRPSFERVCEKLAQAGEEDLQRQIRLIKGAFYARFFDPAVPSVSFRAQRGISSGKENFLEYAEKIAQQIMSEAISDGNGRLAWVGLGFSPVTQKMQIQAISENLYDGRVGVSLFFAALYSLTQKKEYRQQALAALSSLRENLKQTSVREALARRIGLGICAGISGLIYAFARISAFLKEKSLLKEAGLLVDAITPKLIEEDAALDVESGSAGAIVALLFLAKSPQHRKKALAKALQCGEHLLQSRRRSDSGHAVWFLPGIERPLTGFSHGAAGFAYALQQLHYATKRKPFLAAANEAIAYENSLFSKKEKNWPDLRHPKNKFLSNWCHGAAGIGLARLGTAAFFSNAQKDIQHSVDAVLKADLNGYDHLCCGTAGRIDTLIEASLKCKKPDLLLEAKKRVGGLLQRAEQEKKYSLIVSADGDFQSLSLFQGLAGIGYQCLRLIAPKQIPSILLFQ